jgi:DNA-binding cell septation regulator SpoVG
MLVAEVEIVFGDEAGVLSGMKLVGVRIWKSESGPFFVTLPAKPGKSGRYFDYLRPAKPGNGTAKALKEQILRQWEAVRAAETSVA